MLASAQLAYGHAFPTAQTPSAGSAVSASPKEVFIDFDAPIEPAFSSITVSDAHGKSMTDGNAEVDSPNQRRMSVRLMPLTPGDYTVAWMVTARDGHHTQGHYNFTMR
ncbi:copper resistance CopC family protein [Paraburkholderia humisilvae]|nr:copper resistance CopC family protein [Paraburkholderia humisilvae]